MSVMLDRRYMGMIQYRLDGFKKVGEGLWNFRCPFCGDSKHSKIKARGYLFHNLEGNGLSYKCHNCGVSYGFGFFLKLFDASLAKKYWFEKMKDTVQRKNISMYDDEPEEKKEPTAADFLSKRPQKETAPIEEKKETPKKAEWDCTEELLKLPTLRELPSSHPAVQYAINRKLPDFAFDILRFTEGFKTFTNEVISGKFAHTGRDPRIVIPFMDFKGRCFGFAGRSIDPKCKLRYITIKTDDRLPSIFGLDRLNPKKPVYCCEGQIDSLFLPNCISVAGASYGSQIVKALKNRLTIVCDNERRNAEVVNQFGKMIYDGYRVVLWRDGLGFKDINEAIMHGYSVEDLLEIIEEDAVQGTEGILRFEMWKRF